MPLRLTIPVAVDEPPAAFAARLAARNGVRARELCSDFNLDFQRIVDGDPAAIAALADLANADKTSAQTLLRNAVRKDGREFRLIRGQRLNRTVIRRDRVLICPACLQHDIETSDLPPEASARARLPWLLTPVQTCPIHHVALIQVADNPGRKDRHDFAIAVENALPRIGLLVSTATPQDPSSFETYFATRLDGTVASPWLDTLELHAALKTCEMLGSLVLFGRRDGLDDLTDHDRRRAGQAGFEVARNGEPAVRGLLDSLLATVNLCASGAGPQAVYGRCFWDWISRGAQHPAYDPLRDIVRAHAFENIPLAAGESLLGKSLAKRRWHTVNSAAAEAGLHPKRIRKMFVAAGLVPAGDPDGDSVLVPADEAAAVIASVSDSVSAKDLQSYAHIPRVHAVKLVEHGFLQPFLASRGAGAYERFAKADVDAFICRLLDGAEPVEGASPGAVNIPAAVKRSCCNIAEVVSLVLDRRLKWTGRLVNAPGYMAVLVNLDEVRALVRGPEHGGLTLREVEQALQTSAPVVTALIEIGILPVRSAVNPMNRCPMVVVDPGDLAAFQRDYVSLTVLARKRGRHFRLLRAELEAAGIKPAFDPAVVKATFYRRKEVG